MIAVAVAGSQRSDCCGDTSAEQSLSWRLSLTGGWLDGRGDTCTRADVSVSISFVLLSIVLTKVCLMNVSDPDTGRITRAHQTPFQPPGLLQGAYGPCARGSRRERGRMRDNMDSCLAHDAMKP